MGKKTGLVVDMIVIGIFLTGVLILVMLGRIR